MARRPNYNFEKRQKEMKRQKKKEKKLEERRAKKAAAAGNGQPGEGRMVRRPRMVRVRRRGSRVPRRATPSVP